MQASRDLQEMEWNMRRRCDARPIAAHQPSSSCVLVRPHASPSVLGRCKFYLFTDLLLICRPNRYTSGFKPKAQIKLAELDVSIAPLAPGELPSQTSSFHQGAGGSLKKEKGGDGGSAPSPSAARAAGGRNTDRNTDTEEPEPPTRKSSAEELAAGNFGSLGEHVST